MENGPLISDVPSETSIYNGFPSQPCLMTPEGSPGFLNTVLMKTSAVAFCSFGSALLEEIVSFGFSPGVPLSHDAVVKNWTLKTSQISLSLRHFLQSHHPLLGQVATFVARVPRVPRPPFQLARRTVAKDLRRPKTIANRP